jgi:hypothetical protein
MPEVGGISQGGVIAEAEVKVTWGIRTDVKLAQDCCALAGGDVSAKTNGKHTKRYKHV